MELKFFPAQRLQFLIFRILKNVVPLCINRLLAATNKIFAAQRHITDFVHRHIHFLGDRDLKLTFPDDDRFAHAESFYRAMYACGAIKIKLGERKTIFYVPHMHTAMTDSDDYNIDAPFPAQPIKTKQGEQVLTYGDLYPALDDEQAADQSPAQVEKQQNILIDIKGEEPYPQAITEFLRQICQNGCTNKADQFQVQYARNHKTAHITLSKDVIDHWLKTKG